MKFETQRESYILNYTYYSIRLLVEFCYLKVKEKLCDP